jgi:hypothetical protein
MIFLIQPFSQSPKGVEPGEFHSWWVFVEHIRMQAAISLPYTVMISSSFLLSSSSIFLI